MRTIKWLFTLPLILLAFSFALSNRAMIDLRLEPFPYIISMPLYALGFAALLLGFIAGGLMAGMSSLRHRYRARALLRRVEALEKDLAAAKASIPPKPGLLISEDI